MGDTKLFGEGKVVHQELIFGTDDLHGVGLDMRLVTGSITPKEIWERKNEYFEYAKNSKEEWDKMSEDQQSSVLRLVKQGIERVYDRTDEWVPESLEVDGGNFIDVHFRLLFTNIDEEIDRNEEATSFQIKNAQKGTLEKLKGQKNE